MMNIVRRKLTDKDIDILRNCDTIRLYRRIFYKEMPAIEAVRLYMEAWQAWLTDEELQSQCIHRSQQ